MTSWEQEEQPKGLTRRQWVRLGMAAGTVAALGSLGGLVTGQLLPPPVQFGGEVRDKLAYTKFPTPEWWNSKDGQAVNVADFKVWDGATAVWRGLFQNNEWVPGTGFPCLVICIPANPNGATYPDVTQVASLPAGFDLYYEDAAAGKRIVVLYDRCVHLCCYPGWHVVTNPPPGRDYLVPPPTYTLYDQTDPIYCICHGSQYDPILLTVDRNPVSNVNYVGAARVHGPAPRALPLVPIKVSGGEITGGMADPNWYVYC